MRDEMSAYYYYYYYYYYYEVHAVRSSSVRPVYGHIRRNTGFILAGVCLTVTILPSYLLWQRYAPY